MIDPSSELYKELDAIYTSFNKAELPDLLLKNSSGPSALSFAELVSTVATTPAWFDNDDLEMVGNLLGARYLKLVRESSVEVSQGFFDAVAIIEARGDQHIAICRNSVDSMDVDRMAGTFSIKQFVCSKERSYRAIIYYRTSLSNKLNLVLRDMQRNIFGGFMEGEVDSVRNIAIKRYFFLPKLSCLTSNVTIPERALNLNGVELDTDNDVKVFLNSALIKSGVMITNAGYFKNIEKIVSDAFINMIGGKTERRFTMLTSDI